MADPQYKSFFDKISKQVIKDPKSGNYYEINVKDIQSTSNIESLFSKDNRVEINKKINSEIVVDTRSLTNMPRVIKSKVKVEPHKIPIKVNYDISHLTSTNEPETAQFQGLGINRNVI